MEKSPSDQTLINNTFYETLGSMWYAGQDHPIALLRAENQVRVPWVIETIHKNFSRKIDLLDIGCGGGLLTNPAALAGHRVSGIDLSLNSLEIAQQFDTTKSVHYLTANANLLPFNASSFDVVTAMDILEHVENPDKLIEEASRVLRPGGLFFFHTFNRNVLSYLVIIKGVDWFVKNAPRNMHVYDLFIRPKELEALCLSHKLQVNELLGFSPKICHTAFWKLLLQRKVPSDFRFQFTKSCLIGYSGFAKRT